MAKSGVGEIPAGCITTLTPSSRTSPAIKLFFPVKLSARERRRRAAVWSRVDSPPWDRWWSWKSKKSEPSKIGLLPEGGLNMSAGKVVDAHIHFWQLSKGWYTALEPHMTILLRDYLPDEVAPLLKAAGVDKIVVVEA